MAELKASHVLHPGYSHRTLQAWSSEHANSIPKASLVWPLFILEDVRRRRGWTGGEREGGWLTGAPDVSPGGSGRTRAMQRSNRLGSR